MSDHFDFDIEIMDNTDILSLLHCKSYQEHMMYLHPIVKKYNNIIILIIINTMS